MATVNGLQGVPWMVAGAKHKAELGRLVAHAASGGESGIVLPTDLKVTARATPTNALDIAPGACFIPQRAANVNSQSYLAWAPDVSSLDAPASNSAARSYLVLLSVKDPQFPGGVVYDPADITHVKNGPYVFPELYGPVPSNTTRVEDIPALAGKACYAPARLDVPANTTTIGGAGNSQIVDLREMADPNESTKRVTQLMSGGLADKITNAAGLSRWPIQGQTFRIPRWATDFSLRISFTGATRTDGSIAAILRSRLGDFFTGPTVTIEWDSYGDGGDGRETFSLSGDGKIPANRRGTTAEMFTEAGRWNTAAFPGFMSAANGGQITYEITFYQNVE